MLLSHSENHCEKCDNHVPYYYCLFNISLICMLTASSAYAFMVGQYLSNSVNGNVSGLPSNSGVMANGSGSVATSVGGGLDPYKSSLPPGGLPGWSLPPHPHLQPHGNYTKTS